MNCGVPLPASAAISTARAMVPPDGRPCGAGGCMSKRFWKAFISRLPSLLRDLCIIVSRRLNRLCKPAYLGHKRGEVGRSRTTVLQATTHQWIGTYAGAGNGDYRGELKRALEATTRCAEYSSGKWDLSCALRLPGYCSHPDWAACAPDRGYPSRFIHERLYWEAARRAGVRIVCDSPSLSRIFPARRAGLVSAPGII